MIQEGISRNAGSFLRKELGEALRIGSKDSGLTAKRLLPADWYLVPFVSNDPRTARILHRMRESTKVGP